MSAVSRSVRSSSGILTNAITHLPRAADRFEQELENLDVAASVVQGRAPGVQAVPAEEERMGVAKSSQGLLDSAREPPHILVVLDDRNPLPMRVRCHAFEAFQHLIAVDRYAALRRVDIRQDRAPNRMRVQHGTGRSQ